MTEAEFSSEAWKQVCEILNWKTHAIEYKVEKGLSFSIKGWIKSKPQQFKYVCNKLCGPVYHKISDQSRETKPGDAFLLCNEPGVLVIYFTRFKKFIIVDDEEIVRLTRADESIKFKSYRSYEL